MSVTVGMAGLTGEQIEEIVWGYLLTGNGDEVAGDAGSHHACPVAEAVIAQFGYADYEVAAERTFIRYYPSTGEGVRVDYTPRVRRFVSLVDARYAGHSLTKRQARELWNEALMPVIEAVAI